MNGGASDGLRIAVTIRRGLDPARRAEAARLYWQAFGPKLGRVLAPERLALAYVERVMGCDHVLVAEAADGRLLGLAGFKTWRGAFVAGTTADLRAVYGRTGALWRAALLRMLGHDVENRRFLMDGLCVAEGARGQGIGSALLEAIAEEARGRGHDEVRLDVIDRNDRARALYERHGFVALRTDRLGLARFVFGFSASTRMVRRVG